MSDHKQVFRVVPGNGACCTSRAAYHGVPRQCIRYAGHDGPHRGYSSAGHVTWNNYDNRWEDNDGDPANRPEEL